MLYVVWNFFLSTDAILPLVIQNLDGLLARHTYNIYIIYLLMVCFFQHHQFGVWAVRKEKKKKSKWDKNVTAGIWILTYNSKLQFDRRIWFHTIRTNWSTSSRCGMPSPCERCWILNPVCHPDEFFTNISKLIESINPLT